MDESKARQRTRRITNTLMTQTTSTLRAVEILINLVVKSMRAEGDRP